MSDVNERDARALDYLWSVEERRRSRVLYMLTGVLMAPLLACFGVIVFSVFFGWPF